MTRSETAAFSIEDTQTETCLPIIAAGKSILVSGAETGLAQIGFEVVFGGMRMHLHSTTAGPHTRTEWRV